MSISEFSENAAEHRKNMTIPLKSIPTPEMVSCAVLGRPLNDITITVQLSQHNKSIGDLKGYDNKPETCELIPMTILLV